MSGVGEAENFLEEAEMLLREALQAALDNGFALISGDYGVAWDPNTSRWDWDSELIGRPCCCVLGALLLRTQTSSGDGDHYTAGESALHCDRWWLRALMNGFDGVEQTGWFEEAWKLGQRLNAEFRPMDVEILHLVYPQSQTRLKILPEDVSGVRLRTVGEEEAAEATA